MVTKTMTKYAEHFVLYLHSENRRSTSPQRNAAWHVCCCCESTKTILKQKNVSEKARHDIAAYKGHAQHRQATATPWVEVKFALKQMFQ